ncbi:hypothetical protein [Kineosporia sp. A_224]|uniref:hypothetical protein n=1 Tax=Kineosporia sp. A_224 TaxID=1962180 RepID=UPI0013044E5A|nr:hypothetical protein [Kineosporia sp. A_224]
MTPARPTARILSTTALAVAGTAASLFLTAVPASAAVTSTQYADQAFPATLTSPTADKPQSKVWRAGNRWWAVMVPAGRGRPTIHQLMPDHTWRDTGVLVDAGAAAAADAAAASRPDSTADVLGLGNMAHVVSRTATGEIRYERFQYIGVGNVWLRLPGAARVLATGGTESASLTRDSTGTLWVTFTQGKRVMVTRTVSPGSGDWTPATVLPVPDATVSSDDISAITRFRGRVGIMWSDQQSSAVRFAVHDDGTPDTRWTVQTVLSGAGVADDHISLKGTFDDDRVFAAVKTSLDDDPASPATAPLIQVLRRDAAGRWTVSTSHTIADKATRPQIVVDFVNGRVHVLTTSPVAGGTVYRKDASASTLAWTAGRGTVLMSAAGAVVNDVSTTKDPVDGDGIVAIASDNTAHRYRHAEIATS